MIRIFALLAGFLAAGGCLLLALIASRRTIRAQDVSQAFLPVLLFIAAALPVEWLRRRQSVLWVHGIVGAHCGLVLAVVWTLRTMSAVSPRRPFPGLMDLIALALPAAAWTVPIGAILLMAGHLGYRARGLRRG